MTDHYFRTRYTFDASRKRVWTAISESLQIHIHPYDDVLVELGCGYCDFINTIRAKKKYAVDINPDAEQYAGPDTIFHCTSVTELGMFANGSIDAVFASNLLEHLTDEQLDGLFAELRRITKPDARLILMQPNYRYCYREYFDDYTHKKVFSHVSLADFQKEKGFHPSRIEKKFLPLSLKSCLPKYYWLTKIYLLLPIKPIGKQMLIVSERKV